MDSAYRVRKRNGVEARLTTLKRQRRSPACGSPAPTSKGQLTPASTGGRGLARAADTCTPSKPPLSCSAVSHTASGICPPKEILGSRKSARRGKLPLPASYDLLLQLFGALQLVFKVNKMRGHHCVFQSARLAVEQQCGRRFLVSHLAQMKSVYPEVISLRYANIPKTSIQGQCSGIQLMIHMSLSDSAAEPVSTTKVATAAALQSAARPTDSIGPQPGKRTTAQTAPSSTCAVMKAGSTAFVGTSCDGVQSVSKTCREGWSELNEAEGQDTDRPSEPSHMMAVKAEFERRLEKQVMDHYKEFLEAQGRGDEAGAAAASQQWDTDFDLEAVPEIPQADLPPQSFKQAFGGTTPASVAKPAPLTRDKPPTAPRPSAPGARRLSFDSCAAAAELDPIGESHAKEMTDEQVVQKLPEQLRRQSLSGSLPVSLNTLRVLQEQEAQREVLFSSDAKAARRKSAASAMLPRIFDTLRAIYGPTGPAVKLYDQVVKQLTGSNKGASSATEVEDQLAVLAEAAPEWLSLESNADGKKIVRLRRKADMKDVRQKLVQMSGTRP